MPPEVVQPKFETLVIASSSPKRREFISLKIQQALSRAKEIVTGKHERADFVHALADFAQKDRIATAALSPDADAGVPESTSRDSEEVASDKAMILAVALGLVPDEAALAQNPWLKGRLIRRLTLPEAKNINPNEIAIYASDVGTYVELEKDEHILGSEDSRELLKINREYCSPDGTRKTYQEMVGLIIREYHQALEKYTKGNFVVLYRVGFAMWHQGKMISEEWEIKLKYQPLPKEIVKQAFLKPKVGNPFHGAAERSAARVELVGLMKDYAIHMQMRRVSADRVKHSAEQPSEWLEVDVNQMVAQELAELFVVGGVAPTTAMLEFMIGNHISPEQMLAYMKQEKIG